LQAEELLKTQDFSLKPPSMAFDLKKLKSIFIVEDEEFKKKAAAGKAPQAPAKSEAKAPPPAVQKEIVSESAEGEPGKVTKKFTDILFGAIEKANKPGLDYLEYRQSLQSLEKMPMEEKVRYQSAFAMAEAMGATPQKLIESAAHYVNVLKGEEAKFEQALANQKATQIASRKEKIQKLNEAIQKKAEQIKKLTQEMEKHRADMESLSVEINQATAKVETTKNDFIASYNALVAQIMGDVENMKKYLK
jgi:hypothetical protein